VNKADKLHTKKRIIRKNQTLDRIKIELAVERAFANYGFIEVQGENRNYIRLDHGLSTLTIFLFSLDDMI